MKRSKDFVSRCSSLCLPALALTLLAALAGCAAGTADDSVAFSSAQPTLEASPSTADVGVKVTGSAVSAIAVPIPGSVIEISASSGNLTLSQFAAEVRLAMEARESQIGSSLQWVARYAASKEFRSAHVTVVAVGGGVAPSVDTGSTDADAGASTGSNSGPAVNTYGGSYFATPQQVRKAACVGVHVSTTEQYEETMRVFAQGTEALAVGLATSASWDAVNARMDQLLDDEALMTEDAAQARKDARSVFRFQQYAALEECSKY